VPIRPLKKPIKYAGDPPGPFSFGGRPLRILLDLPASSRTPDAVLFDRMTIPNPDIMVWSLCQRDDVEAYWLAEDGEKSPGAIHLGEIDRETDSRLFTVVRDSGASMRGISGYRQLEQFARSEGPRGEEILVKVALADELRVDMIATRDEELLALTGGYMRRVNVMTTADALAIVGLYLRAGEHYERREGTMKLSIPFDTLAWSAVRSQIPAGWPWASALVDHGTVENDDAALIFEALFERLTRALNQRDILHRAMNEPAGNRSRRQVVEAFDYIMVNLVGAFDATARSAHLGAGLPWEKRYTAKWQTNWRTQLGVPELAAMFDTNQPAADLFAVLRVLRNTVHGAGLGSFTARQSGKDDEVLAILPRDDADDIVEGLNRLDPNEDWGIATTTLLGSHFNTARMTEALLPRALFTLNEVVTLCPLSALKSTGRVLTTGPPDSMPFDLGTSTRANLLYGLPLPAQ